jgi:hypothetical protein
VVFGLSSSGGCTPGDAPRLPSQAEVEEAYGPGIEVEVRGNVVEVTVPVADEMLQSPVWARSGPYFYLFAAPSRRFLEEFPGLAAVRVSTVDARGVEVARAMIRRGELSAARWDDGIALRSLAQAEGTDRPGVVQRLVRFGETHTEYTYNPRYTDWR